VRISILNATIGNEKGVAFEGGGFLFGFSGGSRVGFVCYGGLRVAVLREL
jgi:hypothetical protein